MESGLLDDVAHEILEGNRLARGGRGSSAMSSATSSATSLATSSATSSYTSEGREMDARRGCVHLFRIASEEVADIPELARA